MTSTLYFSSSKIRYLLLILIIGSVSFSSYGQSDDENIEISIPFILTDEYLGEILMQIENGEHFFSYDQLEQYVGAYLNPSALNALNAIGEGRDMVNIINIQSCGLEAVFREDYLDLVVNIPPIIKREELISFQGVQAEYPGIKVEPSVVSGWANNKLLMKLVYEDSDYLVENELALGVNFLSWVLDSSITLSNGDEIFSLDHIRLIKDLPLITCRFEVGDLSYSLKGADGVSFITGLSLVRNFNMNPEISRVPSGREPLFLEEDSIVEVEVNGKSVREFELRAGLYSLENFGLSEGVNRVDIFVTDSEGRRETTLMLPTSASLLREKEFDFGLAVGIPERQIDLPVLASYQRAGITNNLTFELREIVPFHTKQMYIEFNGIGATLLGNFYLKAAFSTVPEESADLSLSGKYTYSNVLKPHWGTFGGVGNYDLIIQDLDQDEVGDSNLSVSLYYARPLPNGFSVTPAIIYSSGNEEGKKVRGSALLRKNISGGNALSFDMSYIWDENEGNSFKGTIAFSTVFPEQNQSLMVQQNIDERKFYMNWNKFPENTYGLDLNVSTQIPFDTMERSTYNLGAGYTFPYGNADFNHRMATIIDYPEDTLNTSQFMFSNGFVFAGDSIGFTRTIRDSFIIVSVEEALKDSGVRVNPAGNSQKGIAGKFNVVLPSLGAYSPASVYLEPGELPPGVEIDATQFVFTPTFRSGAVIKVQVQSNVYIGGRLIEDENTPLSFGFGKIYPAAAGMVGEFPIESVEFFTDEDGFFEIYNLRPGDWEIEIENIKTGKFEITIPDNVYGYFDTGDVERVGE
ncbi:MAG: hypothetical protein JEY99_04010 [Spirochaetales bacterium]|nr:hypothetical protein [Spirochaetales bacterium]